MVQGSTFTELINASSNAPKDVENIKIFNG